VGEGKTDGGERREEDEESGNRSGSCDIYLVFQILPKPEQ